MALTQTLTKLSTYKEYLHEIGSIPSYQLDKCFSCGLPAVWLYMKSIGLEDVFFDILSKIKNRHLLFKELFYLLILTNGANKFFPHVPENFLNIEIPPEVLDAQLEVQKPEFEMAYAFDREQLKYTLEQVVKPNKMVRIGDRRKSVGIMYKDGAYFVYHTDNQLPLEYKSLDGCVDLILRAMN